MIITMQGSSYALKSVHGNVITFTTHIKHCCLINWQPMKIGLCVDRHELNRLKQCSLSHWTKISIWIGRPIGWAWTGIFVAVLTVIKQYKHSTVSNIKLYGPYFHMMFIPSNSRLNYTLNAAKTNKQTKVKFLL